MKNKSYFTETYTPLKTYAVFKYNDKPASQTVCKFGEIPSNHTKMATIEIHHHHDNKYTIRIIIHKKFNKWDSTFTASGGALGTKTYEDAKKEALNWIKIIRQDIEKTFEH